MCVPGLLHDSPEPAPALAREGLHVLSVPISPSPSAVFSSTAGAQFAASYPDDTRERETVLSSRWPNKWCTILQEQSKALPQCVCVCVLLVCAARGLLRLGLRHLLASATLSWCVADAQSFGCLCDVEWIVWMSCPWPTWTRDILIHSVRIGIGVSFLTLQ